MNHLVLWLLIGFVGALLDAYLSFHRTPDEFRTACDEHPGVVVVLIAVSSLLGPITLAGAIALALPRRDS